MAKATQERYSRKKTTTASQTNTERNSHYKSETKKQQEAKNTKVNVTDRNSHYNSETYKKNNPKVETNVEAKVETKVEPKVEPKNEKKQSKTSTERNSHYDSSKIYDKINETVKKEPLQLDQEAFNTWMDTATGRQGTQREKQEPGDQKLMKMAGNIVGGMVNTGFKGYDLLKEFASEQMIKGYESNRENLLGAGYTNEQIDELIQKERDKFDINDEDNWSNLIDKQIEKNRETIYNDTNTVEKFALQTVESAGQFGAHMLLAMATGGSSLVTMGLQAGTEKAHQNLQDGYDVNTAIGNGAMTGIMTALVEKLPVDNFGKLVTSPLAQFSLTAIASQAISEGAEEGLEYLIEPQIDKFMLGKEVEYSMGELFMSVALGMSSGGLIGTVGNAVPIIKTRKQFNQLKADMETLIEYKNTNQLTEQETIAVDGALTLAQKALNKFESTSVLKNAVQYESDKVNKLSAREIQENFTKFLQPQMDQDIKLNQEQQAVNSILENSQKVLAQKGIQMDALQYSKLDNDIKTEVDKIQSFANSLNTNVVFNSDLVTENGQVIDGMHIPGVGIVINPKGRRKAMSTFVHELTHGTESSQYYAPLKKLLIDADSKYMEKVKNIRSAYKTVADLSLEDATKEYVAIETQDKLGNEQFVENLVKYNTSLANRIYEGIKQIVSITNTEQDIEYNFLKAFRNSGIDASQTQMQYSKGLSSKDVEREKDLLAIHNISEEKLKNAMDLGGLVMPSIAVTKDSISHDGFGDISVVMDKESIDPQANRGNKIYSRDAWTPTFPSVSYNVKEKDVRVLSDRLRSITNDTDILRKHDTRFARLFDGDNLSELLGSYSGNLVNALKDSSAMKYVYLLDIGEDIERPITMQETQYGNESLNYVIDKMGKEWVDKTYWKMKESSMTGRHPIIEEVTNVMNEFYQQKYGFNIIDEPNFADADSIVNDLFTLAFRPEKLKTFDSKKLYEITGNVNQVDYETWLKDLFADLPIAKGISNGKSYLTPSGNRRSFEQTHDSYTANNVLKAMLKDQQKGKGTFGMASLNSIMGAKSKEFSSIDEIIDNEDVIKQNDETYKAHYEELSNEFDSLQQEALDTYENPRSFYKYDMFSDVVNEITSLARPTAKTVANKFNKNGFEVNEDYAKRLLNLIKDTERLSTDYFEAKPQRVIESNEWKQVYVPKGTNTDLIQQLNNIGVQTIEYDPSIQGDRTSKIKENAKQYKFSIGLTNEDLSNTDSQGRTLSNEQQEYFKDSKVRDENGNLLTMYHGTNAYDEFNVFKKGKNGYLGGGIYLTSDKNYAERYANKNGYEGRIYETYVDIKNPLVVTTDNPAVEILGEKVAKRREMKNSFATTWITNADIKKLQEKGYDGIVWDYGGSKEVSVWNSNQIKNVTNIKPTIDKDIRYSIGLSAKEIRNNHKQYKEVNDNFISAFGRIINKKDMDADYKELLSSTVLEKIKTGKVSYDKMETLKSETWNRLYDYEVNPEYETYKTIRDTIRNKKISMKSLGFDDRRFKEHKHGIGDFAGMKDWNEFRTKHKGTFTFVKDGGTDIDDIYTDLVRNYPGLLEDEDANGAYDKLMEITNYLDNKQDEYFKVHQSEQGVTYEMFEEDFNNKIENMMNEIDTKKEISLLMSKNNIRKNPDNAILSAGAIIPNHDIIRQKYPEFSELNFNKAMLEQLSTGKVTDDTVKSLKEDLIKNVYGNDATKENPASKQVDEFLNDSIQYFLTNAKYESNKEYMDSIASQAINAMKGYTSLNREKIESTYDKVEAKEIAKEAIKDKNIKRRISVAQAVDNLVFNGSNKRMSMFRTLDQNLDVVANGNVDLRNDLRDTLEMKRFEAQNRYKEIIEKYCAINDRIVKELGIKGKSKESKGMQWFMELHKEDGSPYSQQQLLLDFDYTMPNGKKAYENIMEAAKLQSDAYNELFKAINEGREDIYGDIDINNELQTKELEAKYNQAKHTMIQIRDELKNHPSDKLEAAYEQARGEVRKLYKQLQSKIERDENGDSTRRQKLPYRKNYAHHLVEKGFMESLVGKVDGSAVKEVPTYLAGISDDAEPKTGYAKFFSKQTGGSYRADAVEGFAEYIVEAARIIAYDPYIDYVRGFANDIRAVAQDDNMSQFTRYLTDYANDIAGKTGKIDRAVRDLVGDKAFGVLKTLNSRVKANAILGNIRTATTQIFNIPNALGVLVDNGGAGTTQDVMKGAASYMNSILTNKNDDSDASPFIAARYLDVNTQSKGIAAKLENISKFMLSKGDEISTKMIWNAAYQQALRTNQENPVFYADDLTRRAVAGRGVGEVPLALQSQFMNLMIPFQVETNNAFKTLTSKVKDKKAASVLTILLANWIFNAISESLYGDRLLFDPIDVIADAIKDYKEDEEKDEVKSIANTINRLFGETLSSIPGGAYVPMVLGMDDDTTERIFGDNDPSRYGTGNIGLSVFGNAYKDIMQGNLLDAASDLAANFALPGGGKQVQRTIEALQVNGMLPQFENGQLVKEPIYYTGSGKVGYVTNPDAIMDSPENFFDFAKQVMFGKWAGKEAQEYIDSGFKSMGKTQTNIFDALSEGMNKSDSYSMAEQVYEAKKNMTGEDGKLQFIEYLNSGEFTPEQRNEIYDTYYGDSAVTVRINDFAKGINLDADQTFKVKDILSTTVSLKDSSGESVRNSKALSIRKQLDELGLYDDVVKYINDNGLDYGDMGLNKTVGGMSNSEFQSKYREVYGESYKAQSDDPLYNAYASTFGNKSSGSKKGSTSKKTSSKTTASTNNDEISFDEHKAKIDSILAKVYGGNTSTTSAYNKINTILNKVKSSKTKSTINIKSKYSKLIKDYLENHPEDAHLFS